MEFAELPSFTGPEIAGPAREDAPFVLAGRRALALGREAAGLDELYIHPYRVLRDLRLLDAEAVAVRATPSGCERRLDVAGREILERIFVPAAAAGAVLEWEVLPTRLASAACLQPVELELEWLSDLDAGAGPAPGLRGEASGRRLTVWGADGRGAAFEGSRIVSAAVDVVAAPPAPAPHAAHDGHASHAHDRLPGGAHHETAAAAASPAHGRTGAHPAGAARADAVGAIAPTPRAAPAGSAAVRCRLGVRLGPGEIFRLTVAAAPDGARLERALAELGNAPALVRGSAAASQRRLAQALVLGAPAPAAGLALRWAALRLPGFLGELGEEGCRVAGGYGTGAHPRPSARAALCAGLAALPLGDPGLALECARSLLAQEEAGPERGAGDGDAGVGALLLFPAHFLWTADAGPLRSAWPRLLALADRAGRRGGALDAAALGQLALAAESLGDAAGAAALRGSAARLAPAEAAARALAQAGGWAEWGEGAVESAAGAWQERAEAGLKAARALWSGSAGVSDAAATARLVCGVAYGLLGIEADAPRARLRLRVQVPAAWDRLEAERIRMGDAEIRLSYARVDCTHRFVLEPVAGAVPLRAVLEACVPGAPSSIRGTRVDGATAALDLRSWGERTLVPVQLVLDARRVLEVEVERPAHK